MIASPSTPVVLRRIIGALLAIALGATSAHAMKDKDNQGRWAKPTSNDAPDKEVPGFLVNLGPTGARAILTDKTFIVRYVFENSPASGRLRIGDVIAGAFGRPFSEHTFGGTHGYEGPIMELGLAIEKAEAREGKLVLNVSRDAKEIEVRVDLEPLGAFSPTFPLQCDKSERIRARALKYLAEHPDAQGGQSHRRCAVTLALLTSPDPGHQDLGRRMALKWNGETPDSGTWTWHLSYQLIALSEYHLLSRDRSVLPTMKTVAGFLEKAQYSGRILVWDPKPGEERSKLDAAQQLYDGGFGHGPYVSGVGKNGYGPMQYTTILAVIAWQLAGRCGVVTEPDRIKRSLDFIHRGTNAAWYVAYGGEFTLNAGFVDPVAWRNSRDGDNYVGRVGAAIIAHRLSPDSPSAPQYVDGYRTYFSRAYKSLPDGHADPNLGIFWGLLGGASSRDPAVLRVTFDYHKAFFNMMRCHDGSFVLLPGRDYADDGYYISSRYHPTATMALALGLANPQLRIQGVEVTIPGVNPTALKGKMDAAYKAILRNAFRDAAEALTNPRPEDRAAASAMAAYIDTQWQSSMTELDAIEKSGDILKLEQEVLKRQKAYRGIEGFDRAIKRYDDGFRRDPWKKEATLGRRYLYLVNNLKRYRGPATGMSVKEMERFAAENPDSLYGKWAATLAGEYVAKGAVNVAPDGRPQASSGADARDVASPRP